MGDLIELILGPLTSLGGKKPKKNVWFWYLSKLFIWALIVISVVLLIIMLIDDE